MSHCHANRPTRGFTLIELMIVIAIIAIIAAIAIPNLLAARLSTNETAAIATLRNILSGQAQFQQSAKADQDNDGTGEYGGFVELSGGGAGRMAAVLSPAVLSGAFRVLNANGEVSRSGYFFRVFLPVTSTTALGEPQTGYTTGSVEPDLSETTWCAYAWPVNYGQSGNRTFMTNQAGDVVATEFSGYSLSGAITSGTAGAAFKTSLTSIMGPVAIGTAGMDGHVWKQVN